MEIIKTIGYIATLFVASAGVAVPFLAASEPEPETIIYEAPEEPQVEEELEAPVEEPVETPVENSVEEKSEIPIILPAEEPVVQEKFDTPYYYIEAYAGVCPNDQPRGSILWDQQRYLAFTRNNEHPWPGHIYYTDVYWHFYKLGWYTDGDVGIASFANMGLPDNEANRSYGLRIDYPAFKIYWGKMYKEDWFTATVVPPEWGQMANEANTYLHQLDAAFNAQCPGQ